MVLEQESLVFFYDGWALGGMLDVAQVGAIRHWVDNLSVQDICSRGEGSCDRPPLLEVVMQQCQSPYRSLELDGNPWNYFILIIPEQ